MSRKTGRDDENFDHNGHLRLAYRRRPSVKKAKPIKVAFNILDEEAEFGKINKKLLEIAKEIWLVPENKEEKV